MEPFELNKSMRLVFAGDALTRADENCDACCAARTGMISHLDAGALATLEKLIASLVVEERPRILDLMAGWDSHIPPSVEPARLVGLGLSPRELERNEALDERILHDLNDGSALPFEDASFDLVLSTAAVEYLIKPFEVFHEVARILAPGGLHLVAFSSRMLPDKAVRVWRRSSAEERVWIVQDYFKASAAFGSSAVFVTSGIQLAPEAAAGQDPLWGDPLAAVWAERRGAPPGRAARKQPALASIAPRREEVEQRKARVQQTLSCPYCEQRLTRWEVPQTPFCEWPNEYVYVCFNNSCPYFIEGFEVMGRQGNIGFTYRLLYDPDRNLFQPAALPNPRTLHKSALAPRG